MLVAVATLPNRPAVAATLLLTARERSGLTQRGLADRLGVSQPTIAAYESGRRQPTLHTLMRMLAAAGFDLELDLAPHAMQLVRSPASS
jgi:hypothetical protein